MRGHARPRSAASEARELTMPPSTVVGEVRLRNIRLPVGASQATQWLPTLRGGDGVDRWHKAPVGQPHNEIRILRGELGKVGAGRPWAPRPFNREIGTRRSEGSSSTIDPAR